MCNKTIVVFGCFILCMNWTDTSGWLTLKLRFMTEKRDCDDDDDDDDDKKYDEAQQYSA
jgi:hypothetical protein